MVACPVSYTHLDVYKRQILGYPMWNGQMWENIGSMKATGWELSIGWEDRQGDFTYGVGLNLSSVKNKAEKLMGQPLYTGGFNGDYIIRNEEGGEISRFYGYVVDGIFQNQTEVNAHTDEHGKIIQPNAVPGDFRFREMCIRDSLQSVRSVCHCLL